MESGPDVVVIGQHFDQKERTLGKSFLIVFYTNRNDIDFLSIYIGNINEEMNH